MSQTPLSTVKALLEGRTDPEVVNALCATDLTYISLNYENPDLRKSMPWCGTHHGQGAVLETFVGVSQYWTVDDFSIQAMFAEDENVAVFGSMTLTSTVLRKTITSPFSIWCKVIDGKVTYMQFMEDTFATSSSFRSGGTWMFRSNPAGGEVTA